MQIKGRPIRPVHVSILIIVPVILFIVCAMSLYAASISSGLGYGSSAASPTSTKTAASKSPSSFDKANDNVKKQDVQAILNAVSLYEVDNEELPVDMNGSQLPTVTRTNILTEGISASSLKGVAPEYLTMIPAAPDGVPYRIGVLNSGIVVVGIRLSDGSLYTAIGN